jgi:hypothetical protein
MSISSQFSSRLARARTGRSGGRCRVVGKRKGAGLRARAGMAVPRWSSRPDERDFFFLWRLRAVGVDAFTVGDDAIRRRHRLAGGNV